ncbi:hypothetical protein ACSE3M_08935 [Bacillus velezensis]
MIERLAVLFTPIVTECVSAAVGHAAESADCERPFGHRLFKNSVDGLVFGLAMVVTAAMFIMSRSNVTFLRQYAILLSLAKRMDLIRRLRRCQTDSNTGSRDSAAWFFFRLENPCLTAA